MHELYLVESMIDQITLSAAHEGITCIKKIQLVNGKLSGVSSEALYFAFGLFRRAEFKDAILEIVEPGVTGCCKACLKNFETSDYQFSCPYCFSIKVEISGGQELYIACYEGDKKEV